MHSIQIYRKCVACGEIESKPTRYATVHSKRNLELLEDRIKNHWLCKLCKSRVHSEKR